MAARRSLQSRVTPGVSSRYDFPLQPSSMALLIIDIQDELTPVDLTSKEYKHSQSFPRMIHNTKRLLDSARKNKIQVIFTYLEALTDDCRDVSLDYKLSGDLSSLPGPSNPAKFVPGIKPIVGVDISLPKTSCSVFQSTKLEYILRNLQVEQLLVVGQLTDQCVESAVRDAADLGFFVTVVNDACAANSADCHEKGMLGMKGFSRRLTTDQCLQEIGVYDEVNDEGEIIPSPLAVRHEEEQYASDIDTTDHSIIILEPSQYIRDKDNGYETALLRTLRAAGVKFIRFTTVDAHNTIRCKAVPIDFLIKKCVSHPMTSPTSIAEVCFAGLPTTMDVPKAPILTASNVLTLEPDLSSLQILPYAPKTAMVMCTAHDQLTQDLSPLCTRGLLERVLHTARDETGIEFCIGAEIEFMLYRLNKDGGMQPVDNSTFANSTPLNDQEDFISSVYDQLQQQDIPVELIHAESAPGQLEVVLSYSDNVLRLADYVLFTKETIINVATHHGMKAVFLPKTSLSAAGNGLHLHFSFKDVGSSQNAFSDSSRPTGISRRGESFIEGILDHLPSLLSFSLPTVNSYRRVGAGCWTGSSLNWSTEDKEVPLRVCVDLNSRKATNVEYKLADATANIYLELAMILSAGMEGLKCGKVLRPMASADTAASVPLPQSLKESLDCLKQDNFLLYVLGTELSTAYIAVREFEAQAETSIEEELAAALGK
mmetsp:Transcript_23324/g.33292  ORF Transcript_23324/g.33292 Transcript_23324/m.33292 type:complete len:711 (+) Transcript_23324:166-2298(+)